MHALKLKTKEPTRALENISLEKNSVMAQKKNVKSTKEQMSWLPYLKKNLLLKAKFFLFILYVQIFSDSSHNML